MLTKYAKENGFSNTRFYVDDGITGTQFDRPGFQAMLNDIEMGYVSTVIVKSLIRLDLLFLILMLCIFDSISENKVYKAYKHFRFYCYESCSHTAQRDLYIPRSRFLGRLIFD